MTQLGRHVLGLSALLLGLVGLYYRDFATVWQPVPDGMPGRTAAALVAALLFVLSGAALQWRRTVAYGAGGLTVLYLIFTALWLPRVAASPLVFGRWGSTAESLAPLLAALALLAQSARPIGDYEPRLTRFCITMFGVCAIAFGLNHFFYMTFTANMVPSWIPPNQWFWALLTGIAHVLAGIAIISGVFDLVAARLLTLMYASFGLLIWVPRLIADPTKHFTWTANAVDLSCVGAAWVIADLIRRKKERQTGSAADAGVPKPAMAS